MIKIKVLKRLFRDFPLLATLRSHWNTSENVRVIRLENLDVPLQDFRLPYARYYEYRFYYEFEESSYDKQPGIRYSCGYEKLIVNERSLVSIMSYVAKNKHGRGVQYVIVYCHDPEYGEGNACSVYILCMKEKSQQCMYEKILELLK